MKIGISTASFFSRTLTEDSLDFIGNMGAQCAEVFLEASTEYTKEFGKKLKKIAQKNKTEIASIHAMSSQFEPQLFSIGERQKQCATETFIKVLEVAKIIGAKKYVFHGAALLKGALKNAQIERVSSIAYDLAEIAKLYNVKLCWENVSWCMFNQPDFATQLLKNCKSDNLFFTLDTKQAVRSGYSVESYLQTMGERLLHVHICDYVLDKNKKLKYLCLPGKGELDFKKLFENLKRHTNFQNIDSMLEVYSDLYTAPQEVVEAFWFLEKFNL